jgi:hypothetical protein
LGAPNYWFDTAQNKPVAFRATWLVLDYVDPFLSNSVCCDPVFLFSSIPFNVVLSINPV